MTEQLAAISLPESDFRERNREEFGFPYKFSIVVAVYNVEEYINEAVDSILAQDIGFQENVQLILVDDGSSDGSGAICDGYAEQYPDNIQVIHKENGGVSSARNEGLKYAEGRFLNFMDSDDKFTKNVLSRVYDFFIQHEEETDVVCIPHEYFGDLKGEPFQNQKFKKGTHLLNLHYNYKAALMTTNSSFIHIRRKKDIEFDSHLNCGEDLKVILTLLLDKMILGVVTGCKYLYRRILGSSSLINTSAQKKSWYLDQLEHLTYWAHRYCVNLLGYYPLFAQYNIMYDLQWKYCQKEVPDGILTEQEKAEYIQKLMGAASLFDDLIIKEQTQIWIQHKIFILEQKHQRMPSIRWITNNGMLYYGNTVLGWLSDFYTSLDFIKIENGKLILEGLVRMAGCSEEEEIEVFCVVNKEEKVFSRRAERICNDYCHGKLLFRSVPFYLEIPLDIKTELHTVQFFCRFRGHDVLKKDLRFRNFSPIGKALANSYYCKDGWMLFVRGSMLGVRRCGRKGQIEREKALLKELRNSKKASDQKAFKARIAHHILKPLVKKPIWLVSDRINKADDNGEAFFRYLNEHHAKEIDSYFVLSKDSPDFERMSKIGKVVDHLSFKHKLLFLLCEANISSQADAITDNPFQRFYEPYRDLMTEHKFIFLQHGVTQNDISSWLNRYNKNFSGFIAAAKPEWESIVNGTYFYPSENIMLTGLPRFDRLYHDEKHRITIMPTWRKYLMAGFDPSAGIWKAEEKFLNSDYYRFYCGLLSHPRLLEASRELGYEICFMPHPTIQPHLELFHLPEEVKIYGVDTSYRDIYAQSSLVLTDYSSAAFDFAYLRKPLIYCHFDKEEFFGGDHVCTQGYFDYERDGFGEVEYDLEGTVNRIIEYMETGCQLKDVYRERIENFFAFNDQNNCKRVYEAIRKITC